MTLNTEIYIQGEIAHAEVFAFCQGLVAEFDEMKRPVEEQLTEDESRGESRVLMNRLGQGFPAWLMLHYNPGSMLVTPEQSSSHNEYCNLPDSEYYNAARPDCDGSTGMDHQPPHWLKVSFDTGYGYSNPEKNWGCADLHAYYVTRLGAWLDERGIPWIWENEFTGERHTGYAGLEEFGNSGKEAAQWFTGTVLPLILTGKLLEKIEEGDRD